MSATVWKVKAIKNFGKLVKGMEIEVVVRNQSGYPNITEIRDAVKIKYGIDNLSGLPPTTFDYIKQ
jgi:hypothetical protein